MIKKCDFKGCEKAGTCRAPKSRHLNDYYFFCKEHAAEYNKNWNYYNGMSAEEIEQEWERETFGPGGATVNNKLSTDNVEYVQFLEDFLTGRDSFDRMKTRKTVPKISGEIASAFKALDLPLTATLREAGAKYRALAKKHHPDTSKNKKTAAAEFTKISNAYKVLKKYFN